MRVSSSNLKGIDQNPNPPDSVTVFQRLHGDEPEVLHRP